MNVDLIQRVHYLNSIGETEPIQRFNHWINGNEGQGDFKFIVGDEIYYWKIISSKDFKDIIDEDVTDWFFIYSENKEFMAMAKVRFTDLNLIEEKRELTYRPFGF
ncbi:hypothetical protein [Mucilaginibacter sp. AK015]|uniref:hypothetical protein n=1 Tax=Mucilaginibacter sp. AK015 TaxID=2723072 RepID=UPI0016114407|nr:hypothetical protein [Mucilaginibacter sp. AK015]MBB5395998.1 hypothetical protein [Mucilaginibacter sp. AK015]